MMQVRSIRLAVVVAASAFFLTACPTDPPGAPTSNALTLGDAEQFGDDYSMDVAVSLDGSIAAFVSPSTNVIAGDTNGATDLFLRDRNAGTTVRIAQGVVGAAAIDLITVSTNGRMVAYSTSDATPYASYFVYDRTTGVTTPMPSGVPSLQLKAVADDGATALYGSPFSPITFGGGCAIVSIPAGTSSDCDPVGINDSLAEYSANGRFMIVRSFDTSFQEVLIDRQTGTRTVLPGSVATFFTGSRRLSNDGHWLVLNTFSAMPTVYDTVTGAMQTSPLPITTGTVLGSDISSDGDLVELLTDSGDLDPGDTNGQYDLYVWNRTTGTVTRRTADVVSALPAAIPRHQPLDSRTHFVDNGMTIVDVTLGALETGDANDLYDAYLIPAA